MCSHPSADQPTLGRQGVHGSYADLTITRILTYWICEQARFGPHEAAPLLIHCPSNYDKEAIVLPVRHTVLTLHYFSCSTYPLEQQLAVFPSNDQSSAVFQLSTLG